MSGEVSELSKQIAALCEMPDGEFLDMVEELTEETWKYAWTAHICGLHAKYTGRLLYTTGFNRRDVVDAIREAIARQVAERLAPFTPFGFDAAGNPIPFVMNAEL